LHKHNLPQRTEGIQGLNDLYFFRITLQYVTLVILLNAEITMKSLVGALFLAAFLSGCSFTAPPYSPQVDNVAKLQDAGPVKVGEFTTAPKPRNSSDTISLRGSKMHSPINDSYSAYLADALKQELSLAEKVSDTSTTEVTGTLQKNDLDATGFSKGEGEIEARFVVTKAGTVSYDQVKSAQTTWKSSFIGSVAIPAAIQAYPALVQKLLDSLFSDPAFINALK
jgi:PBP1b-binding outer membrane lipoprotein LpoB